MATHRRGLRPSQWPVRDLLGVTADRGRLWDARIGAALAGLLACGAAVTVVVTSGDTAAPEESAPRPQVLPPFVPPPVHKLPPAQALPPAPAAPGNVVPAPAAPPRLTPPRSPRSTDRPVVRPRRAPVEAPARVPESTLAEPTLAEPTLAEQIATGIEQWEGRPVAGWLLVPVQRPADATALLELACPRCEPEAGGRHRAYDDVDEQPREGGRHRAPDRDDEGLRFADDREKRDDDRTAQEVADAEHHVDNADREWDGGDGDERDSPRNRHRHDAADQHEHDRDEQERSTPDRVEQGDDEPEAEVRDDERDESEDDSDPHDEEKDSDDDA